MIIFKPAKCLLKSDTQCLRKASGRYLAGNRIKIGEAGPKKPVLKGTKGTCRSSKVVKSAMKSNNAKTDWAMSAIYWSLK